MNSSIPTSDDVRAMLKALSHAQMQELSRLSGVYFTTLWKIREGETTNPGIATVGRFLPFVAEVAKQAA